MPRPCPRNSTSKPSAINSWSRWPSCSPRFREGGYRLQIAVTDNIAETTIVDNVNFIVMDRSGGQ